MLFAKLFIIIFIIIGLKLHLVKNSEIGYFNIDNTPSENLRSGEKDIEKNIGISCELVTERDQEVNYHRMKRDRITEELDEACFSGRAVLNDNTRRSNMGSNIKRVEKNKKKHKRRKKTKSDADIKFDRNFQQHKKNTKSKLHNTKRRIRKIRFITDAEPPRSFGDLFKPRNIDELKHSYFNGPINDYENIYNNEYIREKKDADDDEPEYYIFRGLLPQPQFFEDLITLTPNITKKRIDILPNRRNIETKVICNPDEQSVVVDSAAPKCIKHIDRQTVEEIIQVDIPYNKASITRNTPVYCSTKKSKICKFVSENQGINSPKKMNNYQNSPYQT